ncbi:MAG: hypothetical protein ACREM1_21415 [Longimicrobiales bacterium]
MSTRSILATLGLVLVAVAPYPGDLADEPADASAEVAVKRGSAQLTVRDAWDLTPSSPFAACPALAIAPLDAPEVAITTAVPWAAMLRPPFLPQASRPPPS